MRIEEWGVGAFTVVVAYVLFEIVEIVKEFCKLGLLKAFIICAIFYLKYGWRG